MLKNAKDTLEAVSEVGCTDGECPRPSTQKGRGCLVSLPSANSMNYGGAFQKSSPFLIRQSFGRAMG